MARAGRQRGRRAVVGVAWCVVAALWAGPWRAATATDTERRPSDVPIRPVESACDDPVAGVWLGQVRYNGDWYRLTLEMRREGGGLVGRIESRFWGGDVALREPPPCGDGQERHVIVSMDAAGDYRDGVLVFLGSTWRLDEVICGSYTSGYIPDGFVGTLDPDDPKRLASHWIGVRAPDAVPYRGDYIGDGPRGQGGNYHVADVDFVRVRCAEAPEPPEEEPPVPELPPPAVTEAPPALEQTCGGCGCF